MGFIDKLKKRIQESVNNSQATAQQQQPVQMSTADRFKQFLNSKNAVSNIIRSNPVLSKRANERISYLQEQPKEQQTATQNITGAERTVNLPTNDKKAGLTANNTGTTKTNTNFDEKETRKMLASRGYTEQQINDTIASLQGGKKANLPTQKAKTDEEQKDTKQVVVEEDKKTGQLKSREKTVADKLKEKADNFSAKVEEKGEPFVNDAGRIGSIATDTIMTLPSRLVKGFGHAEEFVDTQGISEALKLLSGKSLFAKGTGEDGTYTLGDTAGLTKEQQEDLVKVTEALTGKDVSAITKSGLDLTGSDKGVLNRARDFLGMTEFENQMNQRIAETQGDMETKPGAFLGEMTPSIIQNASNMILTAINPVLRCNNV